MGSFKKNIPNAITAGNLLFGCLAIIRIAQGDLLNASWFVIIAALFDFLDGMSARLLKVHSELGKQLDSLADVVTFGVVPGFMLYTLLEQSAFCEDGTCWKAVILPYYGLLIPIFSAVRLAKFNIDERQTSSFIGVPTPANGLMIASFNLVSPDSDFFNLFHHHIFLTAVAVIMSYLLVAEIPLFSLKFKNYKWKKNQMRYIFLFLSLNLIFLMGFASAPFILTLYIILSYINQLINKSV